MNFSCPYCDHATNDAAEYVRHTVEHAFATPTLTLARIQGRIDYAHDTIAALRRDCGK